MDNGMSFSPEPIPIEPTGPVQPHRGTMILVFGILGLVCCAILGIVAWVMGSTDLREMDAGRMDPSGRPLTQAGQICGIISTVLALVGVVIWFFIAVMGGAARFT